MQKTITIKNKYNIGDKVSFYRNDTFHNIYEKSTTDGIINSISWQRNRIGKEYIVYFININDGYNCCCYECKIVKKYNKNKSI